MFRNILKIFTGTFISRIFGFIREVIVASFFGTGRIADAFTLALIFPNLFRQILGEDMVERAFMPPFKTIYDKGDKEKSWKFISIVFNWFFVFLLIVTFVLYLIIPLFFSLRESFPHIFGYIFSSKDFDYDLTLNLILIVLPFAIFIGIAAFVGSMLNFFEKNWVFGLAPTMLSVGVILGIVTLNPIIGGYSIAVGYVFGAFLQMLIQLPVIFNKKFKKETNLKYSGFKFKEKDIEFTTIKRESKIITLNALIDKSHEIFGRFLAATLAVGSTSSIFYALRLFQLPFAIISLPITRGINPELNKMKADNDFSKFNETFKKGFSLYLFLFFPITTLLIISSPELVDIVFRRGNFDSASLALTSKAFVMYSLGLLPMSLVGYYKRVLSLFNKNKYTLYVSIISAIINISFAIILVKTTELNHAGIALASSIAFFINMFILGNYLKRELKSYVDSRYENFTSIIIMTFILVAFYFLISHWNLYFYETKISSLISIGVKVIIVFTTFGLFYSLNKTIKSTLISFVKKS